MTELPEDVLHLICDELRLRHDLSTLFNCAVSSKHLAPLALANLYRTVGHSPSDEEAEVIDAELLRQKWSIYWRTITLASLGKTMYPYQAYLRYLDFRGLGYFLDDLRTYRSIEKVFFQGDLAKFRHVGPPNKWAPKGRLETSRIVDDLGETITSSASSMVEVISGKLSPHALQGWIPRFSRLQRLELEEGEPLGDEGVQQAIYRHCPMFSEITMHRWMAADADELLAKFINGLTEQTLAVLHMFSRCGISTETCLSLDRHGGSLKTLAITIEPEAIPALSLLGHCTALEIFKIEASIQINMQETHPEVFDCFANWLSTCENLKEVHLVHFNSAPAALIPLLLNQNVRLEQLTTDAYSHTSLFRSYHGESTRLFHQALVNQSASLQSLDIRGQIVEGEEPTAHDADVMVNSMCQLKQLTSLDLVGVMDDAFGDSAINRLLGPLDQLEVVTFAGFGITDKVLETLSSLTHLKRATINAYSRFTVSGLLNLVDKLGPGNQLFNLSVDWQDHDCALNPEQIVMVSSALEAKVNGIFDYSNSNPNAGIEDDSDAEYNGGD